MKLFSAVAACLLSAVVLCGNQTVYQLEATSVDPSQDSLILARHIWGHFWGGGGLSGGGGGPGGAPPAVTAIGFDFVVPVTTTAGSAVGTVPASNTPTACNISLGDPAHNYAVAPVSGGCALTVTLAGRSKLLTTHVDTLTVQAGNAAGTGANQVSVRNWAVPVITNKTFQVTAPVAAGVLGPVTVANGPYTAGIGACGTCVGYFSFDNAGNFSATAAAAAIAPAQSYQQTITARNFAGTGTGVITVNSAQVIPVVDASICNIAYPPPANGVTVCQFSATNNPTSWAIVGGTCPPHGIPGPNCIAMFNISLSGALSFKDNTLVDPSTQLTVRVTASNAAGASIPVNETVNIGAQALPAPVMQANTYNHAFPVADNTDFGALVATNSPASFAVASCAGCEGFFTTSGTRLIGVVGASFAASTTYHPVVTATNPTGTSAPVAQNVVIGAPAGTPPVVTATTYPLDFPTTNGASVGLIATTGGAPTSYNVIGCTPACTGFFANPDATGMLRVANAAAIQASTNYFPVVTASNAFGTSVGVAQTVQVSAAPLPPPVVTASVYNEPFPVKANEPIGGIIASNSPTSYAVASCAGCDGFFTMVGGTLTAVAGTNLTASTTYNPVVTATNASGTSPGVAQTVNIGAAPLNVPVVSVGNYALTFPVANSTPVGHINATNTPTSYDITSCTLVPLCPSCSTDCAGFFNDPDVNGNFTVAVGANLQAGIIYHPVVTATNAAGTSTGVAQNVTVGGDTTPPPIITFNGDCTFPAFVAEHTVLCTITATGNPTSFAMGACPECAGTVLWTFDTFLDPINSGKVRASNIDVVNKTYHQDITACNAAGCTTATVNFIQGTGTPVTGSPPVVMAQPNIAISTPMTAGVKFAQVASTNAPTSFTITGCTSSATCNGFFQVNSEGEISATAAGVASALLNGTTKQSTFTVTVQASNPVGNSQAIHTINAYADGSTVAGAGTPQLATYFNTARVLNAAANVVAPNGRGYAVNDVLTITSGSPACTTTPQIRVMSVGSAGEITGMNVITPGSCTKIPPNPAYLDCTGNCVGKRAIANLQWSTPTRSFATRPPWRVAGVDYPVGAPQIGRVYKDPLTLPDDCAANLVCKDLGTAGPGQPFVKISGAAILDGYDFSSGWTLTTKGAVNGAQITNNKFVIARGNPMIDLEDQMQGNSIIRYNTFEFNRAPTNPARFWISVGGGGHLQIDHNYFANAWSDFIYAGGTGRITIKDNVFLNGGIGGAAVHGDWFVLKSSNFSDLTIDYNVWSNPTAPANTQGIGIGCGLADGGVTTIVITQVSVSYNTIGPGQGVNHYAYLVANQNATVVNNYIDITGYPAGTPWYFTADPAGACAGPIVHNGNTSLLTGGNANPP